MSRAHGSTYSVIALLAKNDRPFAPGHGGRHRLVKPNNNATAVMPRVVEEVPPPLDTATLELVVHLDALGADVRVVEREPGECICGGVGDVEIYDGRDHAVVCRDCAPYVLRHARTDAVVVEVCTR